jgi:hypothetical protein
MPASAGRVEASAEDAQTGARSGLVSRVTIDGASLTADAVMRVARPDAHGQTEAVAHL